jgi:hypothetical protein
MVVEASMAARGSMAPFVADRASEALADFALDSGARGLASVSVDLDIPIILTGIIRIRTIHTRTDIRMRRHMGMPLISDAT